MQFNVDLQSQALTVHLRQRNICVRKWDFQIISCACICVKGNINFRLRDSTSVNKFHFFFYALTDFCEKKAIIEQ